MIWRPKPGQRVEVHYRKAVRDRLLAAYGNTGLHGARGVVVMAARDPSPGPIVAEVRLDDGRTAFVPRGSLVEVRA